MHPKNNFDFLRIAAALMVLVSHQLPLTGRVEWTIPRYQSLGGVGLLIFFTMSGYLVCESWQRDPHVIRFAMRRLLRIWPGLAVAVTLTVCVLGLAMTTMPFAAYFDDPFTAHYFGILRFNDAGHLPGLFDDNPNHVVNGSLWTLPIEVRWYEYLALLGLAGFLRWRALLLIGTLVIAVHYFFVFDVDQVVVAGGKRGWKEELGLYFLAGACLQRFRDLWQSHRRVSWGAVVLGGTLLHLAGERHAAYWLVLTFATIDVALAAWPVCRDAGRYGDLSYGVYIYAFPVQQTIVALTGNRLSYGAGLAWSTLATLILAFLSWHLVEAPALKLKPARPAFSWQWFRRLLFRKREPARDAVTPGS